MDEYDGRAVPGDGRNGDLLESFASDGGHVGVEEDGCKGKVVVVQKKEEQAKKKEAAKESSWGASQS